MEDVLEVYTRTIRSGRSCVWTKYQSNPSPKPVRHNPFSRGDRHGMTTNTRATAPPVSHRKDPERTFPRLPRMQHQLAGREAVGSPVPSKAPESQ